MTSRGTPFSLATASTTSNSSLLISAYSARDGSWPPAVGGYWWFTSCSSTARPSTTCLARLGLRRKPSATQSGTRRALSMLSERARAARLAVDARTRCRSPSTRTIRPCRRRRPSCGSFSATFAVLADEARELRRREQRPVDARRRHFQRVMAADRILDIELRGDFAADRLAILDRHRTRRAVASTPHRRHVDVQAQHRAARRRQVFRAQQLQAQRRYRRGQQLRDFDCFVRHAFDSCGGSDRARESGACANQNVH